MQFGAGKWNVTQPEIDDLVRSQDAVVNTDPRNPTWEGFIKSVLVGNVEWIAVIADTRSRGRGLHGITNQSGHVYRSSG